MQTNVSIDTISVNRYSKQWEGTGDEFDPGRWTQRKILPSDYFRFGMGPHRQCIGFRYGDTIVKTAVAAMVLTYNMTLKDGLRTSTDKTFMTPVATLVLEPLHGSM